MIERNGTTTVLVSGATGNLGREVYAALADSPKYEVLPFTLALEVGTFEIAEGRTIEVLDWADIANRIESYREATGEDLVVVDCTTIDQHRVAWLYAYSMGLPTILLGRAGAGEEVNESALLGYYQNAASAGSPFTVLRVANACRPVLGLLQALDSIGGEEYFAGYEVNVSGSLPVKAGAAEPAMTFSSLFEAAGADLGDIVIERETDVQRSAIGLPERYLDCHAITNVKILGDFGGIKISLEVRVMGYASQAAAVRDFILPEFIEEVLGDHFTGVRDY